MKAWLDRRIRKLILSRLPKINHDQAKPHIDRRFAQAIHYAYKNSSAYRTLLDEHGVSPGQIHSTADLPRLPILTKSNTFFRFPLHELCAKNYDLTELADIITSSGQSGSGFAFRLSTRKMHANAWFDIDLGLEHVFAVDSKKTLLVNCLPMGVTFQSKSVALANVSVREDMACAIIDKIGAYFEQIIICCDPLFLKRLLDHGGNRGLDWSSRPIHVILGEETISESMRTYAGDILGINPDKTDDRLIGSSFGVGELGFNLLFETSETIRLRRACTIDETLAKTLTGRASVVQPMLFCYNPFRVFLELQHLNDNGIGTLNFTLLNTDAHIPLPRYETGDQGKLITGSAIEAACNQLHIQPPSLPVVAIYGRLKDRASDDLTVEHIKELLFRSPKLARQFSGAFNLQGDTGSNLLQVQLAQDSTMDPTEARDELIPQVQTLGLRLKDIRVLTYRDFPLGQGIDYERKFPYFSFV